MDSLTKCPMIKITHDHIELGVYVDQAAFGVDQRQRGDASLDELVQGGYDAGLFVCSLNVVVRADAQIAQRSLHARRLW